jgi:hypothetical protein
MVQRIGDEGDRRHKWRPEIAANMGWAQPTSRQFLTCVKKCALSEKQSVKRNKVRERSNRVK